MSAEFFDVLIVGAGLSGVGAACHLQEKCPDKSYLILEGRPRMGGTWDLFRYPGIRSDSDMHTLGYKFKPWQEAKAIADGPSILKYIKETAAEYGVDQHICYGHMVKEARWSSAEGAWTVVAEQPSTGEQVEIRCGILHMCAGYYSYKGGYTPEFEGRERFQGEVIHPQKWPEGFDYSGKRVVVIGSGATAMTLIPAMADKTAHVTMLQRSPTYVASMPDQDAVANFLRKVLPANMAYGITRWKNVLMSTFVYRQTRTRPERIKKRMIDMVRKELPEGYDIETHFTPRYNPWDQRVCLVPNSDLFQAISSGKASVVTDQIDSFTENGILLKSGQELEADVIVTATGLNVIVMGDVQFLMDGELIDFSETITYLGMMFSDIPNLVSTFGYLNASWTLRSDLISEYLCRLINHMDAVGADQIVPRLSEADQNMETRPIIDGFSSGYLHRVLHLMPKQGVHAPWIAVQDYMKERKIYRSRAIDDGVMAFEKTPAKQHGVSEVPVAAD